MRVAALGNLFGGHRIAKHRSQTLAFNSRENNVPYCLMDAVVVPHQPSALQFGDHRGASNNLMIRVLANLHQFVEEDHLAIIHQSVESHYCAGDSNSRYL